jgi:hypothetical protein
MMRNMLKNLEMLDNENNHLNYQSDGLLQGVEPKIYQPLMHRQKCGKKLYYITV